jgi:hypothetical protein
MPESRTPANPVHLESVRESTDPLDLEGCDAKASQRDRVAQVRDGLLGLVQANRRPHLRLQLRHLFERRSTKRLLEHHQLKIVERVEYTGIVDTVCSVCIHVERNIAEFVSDGAHQVDIPPGFDLILTRRYPSGRYLAIVRNRSAGFA